MRGGEKVLLELARLYPDAPIFTLLHVKGSVAPELESRRIHTSFVQYLPGAASAYRSYLPLFPAAIQRLDLRGFELILSSSHCVAKGVRVPPGSIHLSYSHTPMRYVWDRYDDYFGNLGWPARPLVASIAEGLRAWDVATAAGVTAFAANSAFVARRIARYYGRASTVIPPPVDTEFFTPGDARPKDFDLVVSALAAYKRIELILDAYRGTGRRLKIVGSGPERERLQRAAPPEAEFLGSVDDRALRELYRDCRVVVMASVEDFGIVPLEAMACGRPAIVFGEGGGPETVIDGVTGLIFRQASAASLRAVVDSLQALSFNRDTLRARAQEFRLSAFVGRIRAFVSSHAPDLC